MKQRLFNILGSFIITLLSLIVYDRLFNDNKKERTMIEMDVKLEQPEFLLVESPTEEALWQALEYYNIQHKKIVLAQAILETGYFRSRVCMSYNNLFGLYNSYKGDYYKFEHWSESVVAYRSYIQRRYKPPNDYYSFLERIGYAEDPHYVYKLKKIVNGL